MSPPRIPLASATDLSRNFAIVVRLESLLASKKARLGDKTLQNLLFSDREGTEMSATIYEEDIAYYKDIFRQGHEYEIPNPTIKLIPEQFRYENNIYQMTLKGGLNVVDLGPTENERTYWVPVNAITSCLDRKERFDIFGVALSIGSLKTVTTRTSGDTQQARDIIVVDQRMQPVVVTAWRLNALEPTEKIARVIESLPIVQITRVRAARFGGGCWGTTRFSSIILDSDISAVADLRTWANNNKDNLRGIAVTYEANAAGTNSTNRGESSTNRDTSTENIETLLPISSLADQPEKKNILIQGKIKSITNPGDFAYTSCNVCRKGTTVSVGEPFRCTLSDKPHEGISKATCALRIIFSDDTGETRFTLFDSLAEVVLKKSTVEVLALSTEERLSLIDEALRRIKDQEFVIKLWSFDVGGPVRQIRFRPQHIKETQV